MALFFIYLTRFWTGPSLSSSLLGRRFVGSLPNDLRIPERSAKGDIVLPRLCVDDAVLLPMSEASAREPRDSTDPRAVS